MNLLKTYALSFLGLPYKWGGDDPLLGFDCSGLVIEILQSCGQLPRSYDATSQQLYYRYVKVGVVESTGLGALAFYGNSVDSITHIAFMLDTKRIIEAGGGGSKTNSRQDAAKQNAYIRIRPVTFRRDLISIIKPKYGLKY